MSIFSCLADCARLDPLTDCTGLALDGRPVQQARSPSCGGKEESTCDETCIVDSQHSNSPASLYERVRKVRRENELVVSSLLAFAVSVLRLGYGLDEFISLERWAVQSMTGTV